MKQLAPDLFQRRFGDLMEIGRAQIPALAPEWTDHNAHDPGITLMEMLAWVAEAQLYSLSRVRRDERAAYASLLGISPSGTKSSTGLLWSDPNDPGSPAATYQRTQMIPKDAAIRFVGPASPPFTPANQLLWMPGRIEKLETRGPGRQKTDHTATNDRGGIAFLPFGEKAGKRDVLSMRFACRDRAGMFGPEREAVRGAYWPIGVRVGPSAGAAEKALDSISSTRTSLVATLLAGDERIHLKIVSDTTRGFFSTGVILLDLDAVSASPSDFTIEFRSPAGFARPPRVLRIEPNVIPIQQGVSVADELHMANGMPDFNCLLNNRGLKFTSNQEPVTVEVLDNGLWKVWNRCKDLSDRGPVEYVYEFDAARGEITFGNGVNGHIPPAAAQVRVSYEISDGEGGNVARLRKWMIQGFTGIFGVNPEPIGGGSAASDFRHQRREARASFDSDHALVTANDIAEAARELPQIEVARAWVADPWEDAPRTGSITLVAMRSRYDDVEPAEPPEPRRWLADIHRRLASRIPLGTRLMVLGPRYHDFSIRVGILVEKGLDPAIVGNAVKDTLRKRFALTGSSARQPGVPVNKHDVAAWIRGVEGVERITDLGLIDSKNVTQTAIKVLRTGLPRWLPDRSTIEVKREIAGGRDG